MSTKSISPAMRINKTADYKWALAMAMVTVIALGWKYPLLGFVVPVVMIAGISAGLFRGRWVCGNACPRGSFLDTWLNLFSAKRSMPAILKSSSFRWMALIALMGLMGFRLSQNLGSVAHWGYVFWQMCLLTTILAVGLGLRYASRSWCSFCPVGTMASCLGGDKYSLEIHASCKGCGMCASSCPQQAIDMLHFKDKQIVASVCAAV